MGDVIIFQKEDGSPGGVGTYLLKKLRDHLPDETLEPASELYTILIPPPFLANRAADDWIGYPKDLPNGPWTCKWSSYDTEETSDGSAVALGYTLAGPVSLASMQGYVCGWKMHAPVSREECCPSASPSYTARPQRTVCGLRSNL